MIARKRLEMLEHLELSHDAITTGSQSGTPRSTADRVEPHSDRVGALEASVGVSLRRSHAIAPSAGGPREAGPSDRGRTRRGGTSRTARRQRFEYFARVRPFHAGGAA